VVPQSLFGEIKMTDIMFRGILSGSRVEYLPHSVVHLHRVETLFYDIVLMEYLAEEMLIIESVRDF
jgi:hypothetical protein